MKHLIYILPLVFLGCIRSNTDFPEIESKIYLFVKASGDTQFIAFAGVNEGGVNNTKDINQKDESLTEFYVAQNGVKIKNFIQDSVQNFSQTYSYYWHANNITILDNAEYTIVAKAKGIEDSAYSTLTFLPAPNLKVDDIEFTSQTLDSEAGNAQFSFDDPEQDNIYTLDLSTQYLIFDPASFNTSQVDFQDNDVFSFTDPTTVKNLMGTTEFLDYNFDGKQFLIQTQFEFNPQAIPHKTIKISLTRTSEAFSVAKLYDPTQLLNIGIPLGNPMPSYSNIENGIGLFGYERTTTFEFKIE